MKRKYILLLLSAGVLAAGCDQEKTTSQQIDQAAADTKQAAADLRNYTYAQKSEFVKQMQGQVDALNRDMEQLSAKVSKSSDTVKAEAKPKLEALRDQLAQLNKQLEAANAATESTWDSVKDGTRKTYESAKDGFNQARQWVGDKIAP